MTRDGTIRRDPYRNQIDYIITKNIHKLFVQNSRSYSGIATKTDHKLVKASFNLEWWKMKIQRKKSEKIDVDKLREPEIRKAYSEELETNLNRNKPQNETPNDTWNRIATTCKETASKILGFKERNKKPSSSEHIKELSEKQKKLRDEIESTTAKSKRIKLQKERNQTMTQMKQLLKDERNSILDNELQEIEKYKDDSNKFFQAIKKVNSNKPRKALAIYDEQFNRITSDDDQIEIITAHFQKLFSSNDKTNPVTPQLMDPPFTIDEIKTATNKLKNNKATGRDGVHAELLKHGSDEVYQQISELLNKTSETGEYPEEIRRGILNPLAKPPKKGEQVNVRPIILLSVLRKIITITLINRCWERMKTHIPLNQAAYQGGRSTTEQVFAIKLLTEKAITSENYNIFLLLLDMSKAFDTVNRPKLMKMLENILTKCELHMMHLLINDVILTVKIGDKTGTNILTQIGICQGDCLSALLFIFYLAHALKPLPNQIEPIDYQKPLWSALDWLISKDIHKVQIDPQYADDISFIRSDESKTNQIERMIPQMLQDEGLYINKSKTERFKISRNSDTNWKKCKYLGSLLDTEEDIKRRKGLAQDCFKTFENILTKSKQTSEVIRLRVFKTYVESIFLYNSETWTLSKQLEHTVDAYQRRLLRKVINVQWPRLISNNDLYERTKMKPWSIVINKRRLTWLGHVLRLPHGTPAQKSLRTFIKPTKRPSGRPKTTWFSTVISDLKNNTAIQLSQNNVENLDTIEELCSDRKAWHKIVDSIMLMKLTNMQ